MEKNVEFEQVVEKGCGLDVHKDNVVATIRGNGIKTQTMEFRIYTSSLILLRNWLLKHGITHVAMESTGVYWKPIYNILGDHFQILLVNPRHTENVPGRKTDMNDSQWLAKLLIAGLLKCSFIPNSSRRTLRVPSCLKSKRLQCHSHNHPSENLVPSEADKSITQKIKEAGKFLDIPLLDHLIMVPGDGYMSFADAGLI